ncbi:heme/hemin ABC transporter substrate-binding protein [Kumtagia ephedrae]|uniref:Hemin ABC transporter substrate-binding protein n=1 Tax=Kumtagia ephedrae TaxID=2116701 RepID=A0A2P7SH00_9HYPH|nr:ABC transporter substrate-binding protein [Mesorhizobium ephedrae]PSJ61763.1 hemin ABC transporter substrate-binding protein [Mesorhizobium ephedrae]
MKIAGFGGSSLRAVFATALFLFSATGPSHAVEGVEVFPDPSRIVAVGGSITEIVYALGEEKRLVARDSTSVYPREAFSLPDVGYMRALSPEGVLSVKPTGILALKGSGPREAVDVLKKTSIPYIEVPDDFEHEGILDKIRIVGKAIGADEKAEKLAEKVDADMKAAEALTAGIGERKRVLFVLGLQDGKILGSGSDTAADGIIELAGGVNAIQGFAGYRPLADEAIITAKPDLILMMDRGEGDHEAVEAQLLALPAILSTPAGEQKRLVRMGGAFLLGFGPRTADAVRALAGELYGDTIKQ